MSGGDIGGKLEYWATFKLSGNKTQAQLETAIKQILAVIKANGGDISTEARISSNGNPSFSAAFKGFKPPP